MKIVALAADTQYPADYLNQRAGWVKDLQEESPTFNPTCVEDIYRNLQPQLIAGFRQAVWGWRL